MEPSPTLPLNRPAGAGSRYPGEPQDWEKHKDEIEELYAEHELQKVMQHMEEIYNFTATKKQWKSQLKKWNVKKRTERMEYKAILKKKRQREEERPGVATEFLLRGKVISDAKIARYEYDGRKKGVIRDDDTFSNIGTPPGLTFYTPQNLSPVVPPSVIDVTGSRIQSPSLSLDHRHRGVFGRGSLASESPGIVAFGPESPRATGSVTQCSVTPLFRTPPLHAFDWWPWFGDFSQPNSPSPSRRLSSHYIGQLLAPLGRKITNYHDGRIFWNIVNKTWKDWECAGCRVIGTTCRSLLKCFIEDGDFSKGEEFIGAIIQEYTGWDDVSDTDLLHVASLIGSALCQLRRYSEAKPLLTAIPSHCEEKDYLYAAVQTELAACYLGLNEAQNAISQLCETFGQAFGRLAVLAQEDLLERNPCEYHWVKFLSKPIIQVAPAESRRWLNCLAIENHPLKDHVKIPAGTFCLKQEIKPGQDLQGFSSFRSDGFFSTVWLDPREFFVLQRAGEVVRELHMITLADNVGFHIGGQAEDRCVLVDEGIE